MPFGSRKRCALLLELLEPLDISLMHKCRSWHFPPHLPGLRAVELLRLEWGDAGVIYVHAATQQMSREELRRSARQRPREAVYGHVLD